MQSKVAAKNTINLLIDRLCGIKLRFDGHSRNAASGNAYFFMFSIIFYGFGRDSARGMFTGMILGLATGCVLGIFQGKIGIFMCYGLVFGLILGVIVGTVINKFKSKKYGMQ